MSEAEAFNEMIEKNRAVRMPIALGAALALATRAGASARLYLEFSEAFIELKFGDQSCSVLSLPIKEPLA